MSSIFFSIAGAISIAVFFIHVVLGGKRFIGPFLQNDIPENQKWMTYYAWHATSVCFVFLAASFIATAMMPARTDYALIGTCFAASLVIIGLMVCVKGKIAPQNFPGIPVLSIVSLLGLTGLLV